jgi:hypothetical protein
VRIPKIYNGTRRTNFQFSYTGNHSGNLFDQYATVPIDAVRAGDFSAIAVKVIDPATGQPFADNRIPADRIDPGARVLLDFIPAANLPGLTRNFHYSTTTISTSNNVSLRVTHNFNAPPARRGRGRRPQRGGGGGAARPGAVAASAARAARGNTATVNMNVSSLARAIGEAVFPTLRGVTRGRRCRCRSA